MAVGDQASAAPALGRPRSLVQEAGTGTHTAKAVMRLLPDVTARSRWFPQRV